MQDMLRLTTNGTDYMQEFLSTENQYRMALSVLSSAGRTRDAAAPELSDEEKLRVGRGGRWASCKVCLCQIASQWRKRAFPVPT